jgi:hypothetical protein
METVSITEYNNTNNLENIVGKAIIYSEKPDITFINPLRVYEDNIQFKIYDKLSQSWHYFLKSQILFNIIDNKIDIYYKKKDLFNVYQKRAFNEYKIFGPSVMKEDCKNVSFISSQLWKNIGFVFNYKDKTKYALLAFLISLNKYRLSNNKSCLPTELIDNFILPMCGGSEDVYNTIAFENEYKGNLMKTLNKSQVIKLYQLGMIQMAIPKLNTPFPKDMRGESFIPEYYVLSDEAFNADTDGYLQKWFSTKEKMHEYIQKMLEVLGN